jgi:hypothetical protein
MKKELRDKVWKKYDCKCAYCGEDLEYNKMQVDHIEPKYLNGADEINNYNPSCRQCNFYKGTFDVKGFKKQLATLIDRVKKPFIVRLAMKYGLISFKPFDGKFYYEKHQEKMVNSTSATNRYAFSYKEDEDGCVFEIEAKDHEEAFVKAYNDHGSQVDDMYCKQL